MSWGARSLCTGGIGRSTLAARGCRSAYGLVAWGFSLFWGRGWALVGQVVKGQDTHIAYSHIIIHT